MALKDLVGLRSSPNGGFLTRYEGVERLVACGIAGMVGVGELAIVDNPTALSRQGM